MKNLLTGFAVLLLLLFTACQETAKEEKEEAKPEVAEPDYAAFDKKVAVIRDLFEAHCNEDLELQLSMVSDTVKMSPPHFNGNVWVGKEEYKNAMSGYHEAFENIQFHEGIELDNTTTEGGMWSGSVFPKGTANNSPDAIRTYGTWTATHSATGKDVGVKYFGLFWVNDDGMITRVTEYFDVNGIAAQLAEE